MNAENAFSNKPNTTDSFVPVTVDHRRSGWVPAIVVGVAVSGFSLFQYSQIGDLRRQLNANRLATAEIQNKVAAEDSALAGTASELKAKLETTTQQTSRSIANVRDAATRHADVVAGQVATTLERKNAERQAAVDAELAGVKNDAADTATKISTKIDGVGANVDTVKTDLASTKAVVDKTASDLQRATGDMGIMSGLIATNGKQIEELRARGDRNIYEFSIAKKDGLQKVGDVQVRLTKVDEKRNRYTMVVMADDKLVEKKDKTTNEPVQFYAAPAMRAPYEIVVNQVGKDTIKGYLATPKLMASARK